jgi:acetolactate synthase-1/2/3 large subunit
MKVADAVAHILKKEGTEFLFAYPVNHLIEAAAKVDIRTIIVRQERIGLHMADALSRVSSGRRIGVFCMQSGPGSENAFGGVAQAFGDSSPIVVLPGGYPRDRTQLQPNFNSALNYRNVTKHSEQLLVPEAVTDALRRAFTQVKNGRPRPALVEIPGDLTMAEVPDELVYAYKPTPSLRYGPDPADVETVADVLLAAERPVIFAGQGVHYARAWESLKGLAELLEAPVTSSLNGKSAFPDSHPLALGCGNRSHPKTVHHYLYNADVVFGIGCSFTRTSFGIPMPTGKTFIHATLDPADLNKDLATDYALIGDADLTLKALLEAIGDRLKGKPRGRAEELGNDIKRMKDAWLAEWMPRLTLNETPINPYRVIWDLMQTVDPAETIITHDAGSPRDQLAPFWRTDTPLSYLGWGKTTQLGYGLGLAMGAKLAHPDKLCINWWGDAAIGFTGMDFETAVRERIPILSILSNNFSMACEIPIMQESTAKYGATNISGNYADMAKAFGGYGERVETPDQIIPALKRGIAKTQEGIPALIEVLTAKETSMSKY